MTATMFSRVWKPMDANSQAMLRRRKTCKTSSDMARWAVMANTRSTAPRSSVAAGALVIWARASATSWRWSAGRALMAVSLLTASSRATKLTAASAPTAMASMPPWPAPSIRPRDQERASLAQKR